MSTIGFYQPDVSPCTRAPYFHAFRGYAAQKFENFCLPGVDPLLDFGQTSSNTAAPAASAFPDSQLSDLVDFGSGTAGGMTATPQDSNTDLEVPLQRERECRLVSEPCEPPKGKY